jgi:hypothetical protein
MQAFPFTNSLAIFSIPSVSSTASWFILTAEMACHRSKAGLAALRGRNVWNARRVRCFGTGGKYRDLRRPQLSFA